MGCDTQLEPEPEQTTVNEHVQEKPNTEQSGGSEQPSGTSGENDSVPEVPKYTVKFAKGNNTDEVSDLPADLTVESGTVLTAEQLKPLTNTKNYVFVGWYDGETEAKGGHYTVTKDVTLTAQWNFINVTEANFTESLTKAMANPGITLILEDNITVLETITISSGNVTIDLNGKTLKSESRTTVVEVEPAATLTIMDTGTGGSISGGDFIVWNSGSLTVEGGSISEGAHGVHNSGTMEVTGGNISGDLCGVVNNGEMTVTGGNISGNLWGVQNDEILTVEGGSISGGEHGVENYGTMEVTGGSISGGKHGVSNYGSLKVKGGRIRASGENSVGVYCSGTLEVTGGIISANGENSFGVSNYGSLNLSREPKITTSDESGAAFLLKKPITIVGALTGDGIDYSVKWEGETTAGTTIVIGGEQVILTADIAQKFTFKDIEVEFEESTKALVVKTN